MEYIALFKLHEIVTVAFLAIFGFMGIVSFGGVLNLVWLDRDIRKHYAVRMTVFDIFYKRFSKQKKIKLEDERKRAEKRAKAKEEMGL